jgi:uncharacterized membrane protein
MMKSTFFLSVFLAAAIVIVSCEYEREEDEVVAVDPIDSAVTVDTTTSDTTATTTDTTTTDTTTTPPAVTYDNTVKAIMTDNCVGCHAPGGQFPDLSTYAGVNAKSARVKDRASVIQNMPPGANTMTTSDRDVLKDWIESGAKEN